jgi:hypothetical protein
MEKKTTDEKNQFGLPAFSFSFISKVAETRPIQSNRT